MQKSNYKIAFYVGKRRLPSRYVNDWTTSLEMELMNKVRNSEGSMTILVYGKYGTKFKPLIRLGKKIM